MQSVRKFIYKFSASACSFLCRIPKDTRHTARKLPHPQNRQFVTDAWYVGSFGKVTALTCTSSRIQCQEEVGTMAMTMKQTELDVVMSVEIEAESRRVLNALTIPEYMEAWLQMPDAEKLWCFADRRKPNSFQIDLCSANAPRARIKGYCLRLDPDRIIYLWRNPCIVRTGATMVDIHLKSGPGQCTINLKHGGFCNMEESLWHSWMWHRSLNKLGRLMTMMNGCARTGVGTSQPTIHLCQRTTG
jgi:uncharacterized protein YndB with AHSA1/START domain